MQEECRRNAGERLQALFLNLFLCFFPSSLTSLISLFKPFLFKTCLVKTRPRIESDPCAKPF